MAGDERNWWALLGGVGISLVGIGFLVLAADHLASEHSRPVTLVLGGGVPLLVALGTVLVGAWIARSDASKSTVARLLGWWGFGLVMAASMGITSVVYEQSHGVALVDTAYIVINNTIVGAAGGLLIGYFNTRSRRHAEQLAAERDQLETERERLEVLNRVVRHDIRNDMTVVIGWLAALDEHVDDGGREALDRVRTASDHVVELTRIAHDYVDVIVGETRPDLQPVSLSDVLETELQTRRDAYPDASFTVGDVPEVTVRANEMLGAVFRNVLNNAVQHNDERSPTVTVRADRVDGSVIVCVADHGPGIPDDRKESVFGKGEHGLDSSGTGIGLYLTETLVAEYGGDIRIEDNEPKGTVVEIELPVASSTDRPPARVRPGSG